ncbi:hypothetical protein NYZ25_19960, partial [Acinetobacter baumannii]|nr:hypothetical protein [Acinetobacter baumannii]
LQTAGERAITAPLRPLPNVRGLCFVRLVHDFRTQVRVRGGMPEDLGAQLARGRIDFNGGFVVKCDDVTVAVHLVALLHRRCRIVAMLQ